MGGNMGNLVARMDKRLYALFGNNWDDTMLRERILKILTPGDTMLDLGAGAGIIRQMNFRGLAGRVCGIDLDPRILTQNRYLDEALHGSAEAIPYPSGTFDFVIANNVMEHIADPHGVYREICRVLKPGGRFLFKTPNKWHYMPLIARLTPLRFHQYINRIRGRSTEDTFPTKYLANSPGQIRELAKGSGLRVESIELIEGRPEYTRLTAITYLFGYLYERIVNRVSGLSVFRILIIGQLRKP
jgi:ubiquinone/menaquinone biosynthesis C-methylase UbiE